jgi:hypothetical protein
VTYRADSAAAWEQRYDRGELLPAQDGPAGTLLVEGFAAREGVLTYRDANGGLRRELVPAETLAASAGGLARAPVTLEHPSEDVSPDNVGQLGVGDTDGEVSVEKGGFVRVRLAVRRRDAVDAIRRGKQELSPGYRVRVEMTAGTHPVYGAYDGIQVEREYNHLAIVDAARGGHEVRLRADAAYSTETITGATTTAAWRAASGPTSHPKPQGGLLKPLVAQLVALMGLPGRYDSDEAALEAATNEIQKQKSAEDEEQTQIETLTAERDAAMARAMAAEGELEKMKAAETARGDAADRAVLETTAKAHGIDPAKHATTGALRVAIASKFLGREVRADEGDVYLRQIAKAASDLAPRTDGRSSGRDAWGPTDPAPRIPEPRQDNDDGVIDYNKILRNKRSDARTAGGEQ